MAPSVLFLLKQRTVPWSYTVEDTPVGVSKPLSSGLFNSARFVADMLAKQGVTTRIEHCIDGNCIDRLIHLYKPDYVILEAYWVTPDKLAELAKLHPKVFWIIRNHSRTPFMSCEGLIMDWSLRSIKIPRVAIASNTQNTTTELRHVFQAAGLTRADALSRSIYLPNFYVPKPLELGKHWRSAKFQYVLERNGIVNIGCFGAIRPLKNQLLQAIAAIGFAENNKLTLRFHINGGRVETYGSEPLKNIRLMFSHLKHHTLVEYDWLDHADFLKVIRQMDILMQCSLTETFNIVTADAINEGVPVVVSPEIFWVDEAAHVDPTSSESMIQRLQTIYNMTIADYRQEHTKHYQKLMEYSTNSIKQWTKRLGIPFRLLVDESPDDDSDLDHLEFTGPQRRKVLHSK